MQHAFPRRALCGVTPPRLGEVVRGREVKAAVLSKVEQAGSLPGDVLVLLLWQPCAHGMLPDKQKCNEQYI